MGVLLWADERDLTTPLSPPRRIWILEAFATNKEIYIGLEVRHENGWSMPPSVSTIAMNTRRIRVNGLFRVLVPPVCYTWQRWTFLVILCGNSPRVVDIDGKMKSDQFIWAILKCIPYCASRSMAARGWAEFWQIHVSPLEEKEKEGMIWLFMGQILLFAPPAHPVDLANFRKLWGFNPPKHARFE